LIDHSKTIENRWDFTWNLSLPAKSLGFWGAFGVAFGILLARNHFHDLLYPMLYVEDASVLFSLFYNDPVFSNVAQPYNGYINFLPHLMAYFINHLPVKWIPHAYALSSLTITALSFSVLYQVANRVWNHCGFALCYLVLVSLLPFGDFQTSSTLLYQVWHFWLIQILLLFLPLPRIQLGRIVYGLMVSVLIWTHAFSLFLIPIYIWRALKVKEYRWDYSWLALSGMLFYLFGMNSQGLNLSNFPFVFSIFMHRVVIEGLLGPEARSFLNFMGANGILAAGVVLGLGWLLVRFRGAITSQHRNWLFLLVYLIGCSLVASVMGRDRGFWEYYHAISGSVRYVYILKILFWGILLTGLLPLWREVRHTRVVQVVLLLVILGVNSFSMNFYRTPLEEGNISRQYVGLLSMGRGPCASDEKKYLYLDWDGKRIGWSSDHWRARGWVCLH